MVKNFYALVHSDLDGVGSEILANLYDHPGNKSIIRCENNQVDAKVEEILSEGTPVDIHIIDLSITRKTAELLNLFIKSYPSDTPQVLVADHHEASIKLSEEFPFFIADRSRCGCRIYFDWLSSNPKVFSNFLVNCYKHLILLIDDYDRWIHSDPKSKRLDLLRRLMGNDAFINRFLMDSSTKFTSSDLLLITTEENSMNNYLYRYSNTTPSVDNYGNKYAFVFSERYISLLGNYLIKKFDLDYVIILAGSNGSVSLRSNGKVDVSKIAQRLGGGGHKSASGFPVDLSLFKSFLVNKIQSVMVD